MVSSNGVANVLGANACTIQTYSPTWTRAYVRCNCANGGGVGFVVDSKRLWEARANALIMWSSIKEGWVWNVSNMVPYIQTSILTYRL